MRNTKLVLAVTLLQGLGLDVRALEIEVGDRPINLPLPDGFVELTPAMSPYYETMRAYIGPNNLRYATLITANDAEALLRGQDIELERYINVESENGISATSVSSAQLSRRKVGHGYPCRQSVICSRATCRRKIGLNRHRLESGTGESTDWRIGGWSNRAFFLCI
jgi:hypothetical protein